MSDLPETMTDYDTYSGDLGRTDIDTGKHYRSMARFPLNDIDVERGFLEVQLDPYALAPILDITDMVQFTVFKKSIRWGGSDAKDLKQDILDIIGACERKLELLEYNY